MAAKGLLIDITRCVGCGVCHDACAEANGNPETPMDTYSCDSWTAVQDKGDEVYVRKICMHCEDPACASVCPVAALKKTEGGAVVYDSSRCMGCRYCMVACPFQVPTYEWNEKVPLVRKCIMCEDRQKEGGIPACAEACPTEATLFGDREDLLAEARRRLLEDPDAYYPHIYGEREVGGTAVLFLAPKSFAELGFPMNLGDAPLPELTYRVLRKIPTFAAVAGTGLFGLYWIINRRMTIAHEEVVGRPTAAQETEEEAGKEVRS